MGSAQVSMIHCNDVVKASPVVVCPAAERATLDFLSNGRRDPVGSDGLIEAGDGDLRHFRAG